MLRETHRLWAWRSSMMSRKMFYALTLITLVAWGAASIYITREVERQQEEDERMAALAEQLLISTEEVENHPTTVPITESIRLADAFGLSSEEARGWWSASDPSVVGVHEDTGLIRPVADGTATVCRQPSRTVMHPRECWPVQVSRR